LRFYQTFPTHALYFINLYSILYNLTRSGTKFYIRKPDPKTKNIFYSIALKTYSLLCLNYYYDLIYLNGIKIIPKNIAELLTPRSLAILICDDGSKGSNNKTILHTRSYTFNEMTLLQEAIKLKFNLNTRYYEKEEGQWVIYIPVQQAIS
jgi:LAGLIDADG DNA endonuclease family